MKKTVGVTLRLIPAAGIGVRKYFPGAPGFARLVDRFCKDEKHTPH
ncbi:MAG: hypothetical protein KDK35_20470 [Leptospiraceae bacterium]|nr:hypothetical protein [Leptospiraceae bacterium]